jgi:hypothetical protein
VESKVTVAVKTARKQRGRPFKPGQSGNPAGKPKGARHRTTVAVEALLDGEAERLTRKAIEMALDGDLGAMRLCLERISAPRRDRPLRFELPRIASAADAVPAFSEIFSAVARGDLTPGEAETLSRLLETFRAAVAAADLETRVIALEQEVGR